MKKFIFFFLLFIFSFNLVNALDVKDGDLIKYNNNFYYIQNGFKRYINTSVFSSYSFQKNEAKTISYKDFSKIKYGKNLNKNEKNIKALRVLYVTNGEVSKDSQFLANGNATYIEKDNIIAVEFDKNNLDVSTVENRKNYIFKDEKGQILDPLDVGFWVDSNSNPVNKPYICKDGCFNKNNKIVFIKLDKNGDCSNFIPSGKYILEIKNIKTTNGLLLRDVKFSFYVNKGKCYFNSIKKQEEEKANLDKLNKLSIYTPTYNAINNNCTWDKLATDSSYKNKIIDVYGNYLLLDDGSIIENNKLIINVNKDDFKAISFIKNAFNIVNGNFYVLMPITTQNYICKINILSSNGNIKCLSEKKCTWDNPCNVNENNFFESNVEKKIDLMGAVSIMKNDDKFLYYQNGDIKEKTFNNSNMTILAKNVRENNKPKNIKFISGDYILDNLNVIYKWSDSNNSWIKYQCSENIPSGEITKIEEDIKNNVVLIIDENIK